MDIFFKEATVSTSLNVNISWTLYKQYHVVSRPDEVNYNVRELLAFNDVSRGR